MTIIKSTLVVTSFMFFALVSCDTTNESSELEANTMEDFKPDEATTPTPEMMPVPAVSSDLSTPEVAAPASAAPALKINPAHGQPGHDCAVAVGAPLGGAPSQSGSASIEAAGPVNTSSMRKVTNPLGAPTPNLNPVGGLSGNMNPAHGQPGHDCAVAVGAPLPGK